VTKISDQSSVGSLGGAEPDKTAPSRKTMDKEAERDLDKEADTFSSLLKDSKEKAQGKAGLKGEGQPGGFGDAILQSMQGRSATGSTAPGGGAEASFSVSEAAQEIADRILVSDPSLSGKAEVRLTLRESVMPGTEVRISKESGMVQVELVTTSDQSFALLASQKGNLEQMLKDRMGDGVNVQVKFSESGREEGDGRSRQQRSAYDEQEE
jgi:type III secretion system needle length determinant